MTDTNTTSRTMHPVVWEYRTAMIALARAVEALLPPPGDHLMGEVRAASWDQHELGKCLLRAARVTPCIRALQRGDDVSARDLRGHRQFIVQTIGSPGDWGGAMREALIALCRINIDFGPLPAAQGEREDDDDGD